MLVVGTLRLVADVAVEEGVFTGIHNAILHSPMGDVPPRAAPLASTIFKCSLFRDGKHVSFNLVFDRLSLLEQIGLRAALAPGASARILNGTIAGGQDVDCG